jgi:hypothetical protein
MSTFQASYAGVESDFSNFNVPAYFSEFGCITSPPRVWTEVAALFSSQMSPEWSGGVAFSYFPAASVQGQFGMVNISVDGSSVTTGDDFNALASQYGQVNAPNTPSQSSAGNTNYPSCPAQSATFLASSSLPPTPNDQSCQCLDTTLSCLFTPQTNNYTAIVGELLDTGCSLLGQAGGNCNDIAGNGSSGTYGRVSFCDPRKHLASFNVAFWLIIVSYSHIATKLSFVFSQYYQANNRNPQSCNFAGNATVNSTAPSDVSSANAAATSCFASASSVFTPTAPAGSGSSSSSASSSKSPSGAVSLLGDVRALWGMGAMVVVGVASGVWTLA